MASGGSAGAAEPIAFAGGEVFRDFTFLVDDSQRKDLDNPSHFGEVDPGSQRPNLAEAVKRTRLPRALDLDLAGAVKAYLYVEYWGGHAGTSGQMVRINGGAWRPIPQPVGTPDAPEHYYRMVLGGSALPLDLATLRQGRNDFQFTAGPQIVRNFDWGFYWVYSFTVRVFYQRTDAHARGHLVLPSGALTENPTIEVAVVPRAQPVQRVDVIAHTDDFNVSGSGRPAEWQHQLAYGKPRLHVGTAAATPYLVTWDTQWLPDQLRPMKLTALIVDEAGYQSVTPVVEDVRIARSGRSVAIARASEIPHAFGVRNGQAMECVIDVPARQGRLVSARLKISLWSGNHLDELHLNGRALPTAGLGKHHDHQIETIDVPIDWIRTGQNVVRIASATHHHPAEVNWPGPVLLLDYAP